MPWASPHTEHRVSPGRHPVVRTRSLVLVLAMTLGFAIVSLVAPPPTVACSCMQSFQPMLEAKADPTLSVFTGTAGANEAQGVAVRLTRWFRGAIPPSGVAVLDPAGFVDPMGGMCGTTAPTNGTEWIFATGRNAIGRYDVSLCTTHAPLDSDLGRELLAEAVAVFGPPVDPRAAAGRARSAPGCRLDRADRPGARRRRRTGSTVRSREAGARQNLEQADDVPVGIDVDVLAARLRRQARHRPHLAAQRGDEAGAGRQPDLADRHGEPGRAALQRSRRG